ncbi:MAG: S8 family serine peptidase, partial [Alistipes sp.]|nr:S8 family serine peptidase [Alistipes sp.]
YSGAKAGADVNCEEAWKLCTGDPSIIVAIVDHCVQWDHPDLAANMWVNPRESSGASGVDDDGNGYVDDIHGYNFYSNTVLTIATVEGAHHGTHVAGTVAAVNNNGTGVCGIAGGSGKNDGVKLMSCQIFHNGKGTNSRATAPAIKYAADNGASIIQCSYGYEAGSYTSDAQYAVRDSAEKEAIDYFIKTKNNDVLDGGLAIFAAGNDMRGMSGYPAAYRDYISVTAMSCDYTPAYYTNYGPGCNVAAPGGDVYQNYWDTGNLADAPNMPSSQVLSTVLNSGYGYAQGTSMACPHMSGVAALGLSYAHKLGKHFTVDEFKALLLTSVNEIDRYCTGTKDYVTQSGMKATLNLAPYKGKMGTGCIDAYQVLMNIEGTPCVPVRVGTKQAVDITNIVGKGASGMTFLGIEISEADKAKVGLEGSVSVSSSGKLSIKCTKAGSARVKIRFIAGGNTAGTDTTMGGMELSKEFVIVARGFSRNDGWL